MGMNSGKTAIARKTVSAPMAYLAERRGAPYGPCEILHYGEGKAYEDTKYLGRNGAHVTPYDPNSSDPLTSWAEWLNYDYDLGFAIYVLNTLEESERRQALKELERSCKTIILAMRTDKVNGATYQDGVITKRGTFQTQLNAGEWVCWVAENLSPELGIRSVNLLHKTAGYCILEVERVDR